MNVSMIVFSPGGNTLKAAKMAQEEMERRGIGVRVSDVTRNEKIFQSGGVAEFLAENVAEHDVLCVGGPVYAHHLHYNVKKIIQSLPKPGGKWGKIAAPFLTYGVISSGIALHEAGALLRQSGRTNVCGMKIEAFHCMSRLLSTKVGEGLPGEENRPVIAEFADRIMQLADGKADPVPDATASFNYPSLASKLKAQLIFRERFWHRHMYPKLGLDLRLCRHCGNCVAVCPVQRLQLTENRLMFNKRPACIHCGECIHGCSSGAMSFAGDLEKFNKVFAEAAAGKGPLPSHEQPKSAVYPINIRV